MIGLRRALRKVVGRLRREGDAPVEAAPAAEPPATEAPRVDPATGEVLPWYLQGDRDDGWDATNPGTEPSRKNLVE